MSEKVGHNFKLYENTGTWATPTWTERNTVQDVDVADANTSADANNRSSSIKTYLYGMDDWTLTFGIMHNKDDAFYEAVRDAKKNKATIELAAMSGDITTSGEDGYRADWKVENFDSNQAMDETAVQNAVLKPAKTVNAPVYMDIA